MVICKNNKGTGKTQKPKTETLKEYTNRQVSQLNENQRNVFEYVMSGYNCFITGPGGTGKSFLLNTITVAMKEQKKNVLITGSTGVASQNIKGVTVHKAFGLPADVCFTEKKGDPIVHAPKNIVNTDVYILDEVSMCRRDVFDSVILSIRKANQKRQAMGKPDIQICLFGDFAQLPPVVTEEDRQRLEYFYGEDDIRGCYAFQSKYWDECNFKFCELTEVVRQENKEDAKNLNALRFGDTSTLNYFNEHMSHGRPFENAISLYSYNRDVERKNREELAKLPDPRYSFDAILKGMVTKEEVEERSYNYNLTVKYGAKVMITCNPSSAAEFYEVMGPEEWNSISTFANGTIGYISYIHKDPEDVRKDYVVVSVRVGDRERDIKFFRKTYEVHEYKTAKSGKLGKYVRGTYQQFPLRLAYACTIHKSQGQTFDYCNVLPCNFAHGQLYVALSRCRKVANIHLEDYVRPEDVVFDNDVLEFYEKCRRKNIPSLFEM